MNQPLRIVITGASTGIGRGLAEYLTGQGHGVWGLARTVAQNAPGRASVCDVAEWPAVQAAVETITEEWPALDALICCAGTQGEIGPAMTLKPTEWSRTVRVNLDGTFYSIAAFHPLLSRAARRAKILCFSGGGAAAPRPNFSAYGAAKAAVVRLVETLAEEWAGDGMDINAIAPGALPTRLTAEILTLGPGTAGTKEYASAQKTAASGREGFEKLHGLIDFLLSEASDGITGRLLSAPWDPWAKLTDRRMELAASDIFTLRRIVPEDRGKPWS